MVVARVGPTEKRPTHHLKLTDGVSTVNLILADNQGNARGNAFERLPIPRSALKTYQGEAEYDDQEMPWSVKQQSDWSGGRGNDDLDSAINQFYDSQSANSLRANELVGGGMETFSLGGYMVGNQNWFYRYAGGSSETQWAWITLTGARRFMAMPFTAPSNYTAVYVTVIVRKRGTPGSLTITLRNNATSPTRPGTQVTGSTMLIATTEITESQSMVYKGTISSSLSSATAYWIQAEATGTDDASNHWEILTAFYNLGGAAGYQSPDGSAWSVSQYDLFYRVTESIASYRPIFFNYKGSMYVAFEYPGTGGAKLYINGDQGVASAGGADTLTDGTKTWITDEWKGCILVVRWGTGSGIYTNYRTIAGNTGTVITVDSNWDINPDTTSEYVILGSDKWTEVTGHGCNQITDVCVFNNLAYFACGTGQDMRKMRRYNNAGTWTITYSAETGSRARFIISQGNGTAAKIWKAEADDSTINYADAVAETGGALTFSSDLVVGDQGERITGMCIYGDDADVWIGKEGSVYDIQYDSVGSAYNPVKMKLDEIAAVKDERNARAMLHHNAYLFFSVHNQLQRYYAGGLDNIGPGYYPQDKVGAVAEMAGYPGMLIVGIDADQTNRGRILAYKSGWHSLWDGDSYSRVRGLAVQTLPGDNCDRLWFNSGLDLGWIPIDLNPGDRKQTGYHFYPFRWESSIETGRIYYNLKALTKYWHSVNVVGDFVTAGLSVEVDYQTDADTSTTWHYLGSFDSVTSEVKFTAVTGKWIRLRYRLLNSRSLYTPRIKAALVEALIKLQIKWQTIATFRVRDDDNDLNGDPEQVDIDTKLNQLETWAGAPTVLTVSSTSKRLHGKTVFIEAQSLRMVSERHTDGNETYIWVMNMVEK